jgi:hypothetical protein
MRICSVEGGVYVDGRNGRGHGVWEREVLHEVVELARFVGLRNYGQYVEGAYFI